MAYKKVVIGVILEGVNTSPDDNGVTMFVQGDLVDITAIAASLPSGGVTVARWIPVARDSVSGFSWSSNPRNPISDGSPLTVKIQDKGDLLGPIFAEDTDDAVTNIWALEDTFVTRTQTAFRIYGDTAPVAGDSSLYLESECVTVDAVTPVGDGFTYDIDVTRGTRGTLAKPHQLRPKNYPANEDGTYQNLYFCNRIDWDHIKIPARVYQIDVEGNAATGIRTAKYGVVTARPRPLGQHYSITIEDATKGILAHKFGGGRPEVSISHCLQVNQVSLGSGYGPSTGGSATTADALVTTVTNDDVEGQQPKRAGVRLTREEAEYLLGETLHTSELPWLDSTRAADLATRMSPGLIGTLPFQYQVTVSAGGWSGAFDLKKLEVEQAFYFTLGSTPTADEIGAAQMLKLTLELAETFEGAISDGSVGVAADGFLTGERVEGLAAGWSTLDGEAVTPGEEAPTLSLRLMLKADFFTACMYLFASDIGDNSNPGATAFDVLACGFGLGFDMSKLDVGTTPANIFTVDPGTTNFLELAVMVPEKFDYVLTVGGPTGDFGPWLKNEALRAMVLWAPTPTTGKMGWRLEDRPASSSSSLNPVKGTSGIVQPGTRLQSVDAIRVTIGFSGKDLAPADFRIIRLREKDTADLVDANQQTIRFWKRGKWSSEALNSGSVPRLTRFYFTQLRGSPTVYKVPLSVVTSAKKIGDFVTFTDPTLQTALGRGIVNQVCQVVGTDNDLGRGVYWVVLLPHKLSVLRTNEGNEAPALKIWHVEEAVAGSQYWLWVDALGTVERASFDITTAFGGIFGNLATAPGNPRVRIVTPARQNPAGVLERPGWLEAYGRITEIVYTGAVSKVLVVFDASWNRGATVDFRTDLLLTDRSYLLFTDRRRAVANVEGFEITPIADVRADGDLPLATYAPPAGGVPYDGNYYTYIS